MNIRQLLIFLIGSLQGTKALLHKILIQKKCPVLSMIIVKLRVCNSACIANSIRAAPVYRMGRIAIYNWLQPHLLKLKNCRFYHTFKTKVVADIDCFLFAQVFVSIYKSQTVALCIGSCARIDFFLGKTVKKCSHSKFILCNAFSKQIQVTKV